jgi:hypothetical protein
VRHRGRRQDPRCNHPCTCLLQSGTNHHRGSRYCVLRRRGAHGVGGLRGRRSAGGNRWPRQETLALLNSAAASLKTAGRPYTPRSLSPAASNTRGRPKFCLVLPPTAEVCPLIIFLSCFLQPRVRGASKAGTQTSGPRIGAAYSIP